MNSALEELVKEELLYLEEDESYEATRLGQAIVASAFSPEDGIFIHEELRKALRAFVMDGDMHVLYIFTPLQVAATAQIDWLVFRDQLDKLDESGIRAFQLVGVNPGAVNRMCAVFPPPGISRQLLIIILSVMSGGMLKENTPDRIKQATVYRRAYTAFQLRDLCNEVPISTIALRYGTQRGNIQTLAQQCHGYAAGIIKFCQRMDWGMLAAVLTHMRDRLEAGARSDLLEMSQVTYVKSWTARLLRENGFRDLKALAAAEPKDLVPVLMMVWWTVLVIFGGAF